ncbi:hypothetical protein J6590_026425 [Homalodisca vitripennis]|nr:hypothetical protein J6590_026425 [Homalodisca vitripennis]
MLLKENKKHQAVTTQDGLTKIKKAVGKEGQKSRTPVVKIKKGVAIAVKKIKIPFGSPLKPEEPKERPFSQITIKKASIKELKQSPWMKPESADKPVGDKPIWN